MLKYKNTVQDLFVLINFVVNNSTIQWSTILKILKGSGKNTGLII